MVTGYDYRDWQFAEKKNSARSTVDVKFFKMILRDYSRDIEI